MFSSFRLLLATAFIGITLVSAQSFAAQEQGPPGLNEKVSEVLQQKMKPQLDAKNWDGALAVIDAMLATVDANSYDTAFLSDIKAKIFLQKNDYAKAIAPMETTLRLADKNPNYFDKKSVLDTIYFLAQNLLSGGDFQQSYQRPAAILQ